MLIKLAIRSIVIMQFKHSPDEHKPEKMYRVPDLKHSNHCLLLSVPRNRQLLSFVHGQGQIINENVGRNDYNLHEASALAAFACVRVREDIAQMNAAYQSCKPFPSRTESSLGDTLQDRFVHTWRKRPRKGKNRLHKHHSCTSLDSSCNSLGTLKNK